VTTTLARNALAAPMIALALACRSAGDGSSRLLPADANAVPAAADTNGAPGESALPRTQDEEPAIPAADRERHAEIGQPAPDFELHDLWGRKHKLSTYRGKIVVLEWFNPTCPAVVYAYGEGELREMKSLHASNGIVWLAINSTAPGEEGSDPKQNREFAAARTLRMPTLLDPTGAVGRAYGARVVPQLFVINERGLLVYQGALDNAPKGRVESLALKTNYVDMAIADLRSGHAVLQDSTRPYGCEIKYTRP
jgi:peroxiredoxin